MVSGAASILLRPFPSIGIAYAMHNVTEPDIDLLAGGGSTPLERTQSWGLSYVWHQRVGMVYERRHDGSHWRDHVGVELDLGPSLDVRTGVGRGARLRRGRHLVARSNNGRGVFLARVPGIELRGDVRLRAAGTHESI